VWLQEIGVEHVAMESTGVYWDQCGTFSKVIFRPRRRIALETGTHSPWISRLLSELGHEVIVAHARKVCASRVPFSRIDP